MPTFKVVGGTHLGIVSCFGEKTFYVNNEEELAEAVRKDRKLPADLKLTSRVSGNRTIWMYEDAHGNTVFEFYYEHLSGHDHKVYA
jgi:hypothetical protein